MVVTAQVRHPHTQSSETAEDDYRRVFEGACDGLIINDFESGLVVDVNPAAAAMHGYSRAEFIGLHPTTYVHPDNHHLFGEYVQAIQAGEVFEARVMHRHRDGFRFDVELRGSALLYQNRPCLLSVIRDITALVKAERLLQQQIATRTREQTTLLEISHTLAASLELKPALILDQLRLLVEYTQGALFVLEEGALVALVARGSELLREAMPFHLWPDETELVAHLLTEQRPVRIADVWRAAPEPQAVQSILQGKAAVLLEGARSLMWVPLTLKGSVMGGMLITHVMEDYFTAHHGTLAHLIANQAAITLDNARLYEQAQSAAILEERQRLAQNLHDAVNQSLFAAGLIAEVLPRLWERDPAEARESLEDLRRLMRGAQGEMRGLLVELQPLALTETELDDLLRQMGNALTGRTNIPVALTVEGEGSLPADVQVVLYRLCQEAMNNIARHAAATRVTIHLRYEASGVAIQIHDNGSGFDPENIPPGHFGLSIMRERAAAVGAQLVVTSHPASGTAITIHWAAAPAEERS